MEVSVMKTVLITGGSRGIGAEMVRRFARGGYAVAFVYCSSEEEAKALSIETGATPICADLSSEVACVQAVREAIAALGHIDVLINNAAVAGFSLFTDITGDAWNRFLSINLSAPFFCARECVRDMLSRKAGRIINISSMWGQIGASCEVHYSAAKAGLIGMTRALAKELAPSNITVNCIAPGVIDTEMNASLSPSDMQALCEEIPLGRLGTPAEIAQWAYFLCENGGDYVTGQVFGVNGGFVI